ncbi:MAG: radical SAM protein [Chloroflexi bacterium]|nr:radical SAM protein [Chloroflexota bacterium]MBU1750796.1 radical SAM protein [Chloroflexota bacterium]
MTRPPMRPRLQTLIFEVTQRCNHACRHCYNVWNPAATDPAPLYPRGELDTPQTLALLSQALDETICRHVTLTGGEPLLRPDLPQILDLLRGRGIITTVISNGRLLTEPAVVDLLDRGVSLFELPLLSHCRETHDRLSGAPGAFDAVVSAMANIRYHGGQFVAVFVATRPNLPDLYEAIKLAFALGAQGLMLNRFNPGGRGRDHLAELLPIAEQMRQALAVANAAAAEFNLPISCSIPIQPCLIDTGAYIHLNFGFCAAGTDRAYYTLDPLGNLRPCNHTPTILGNLLTEPFADLVAPARLASFVEAVPPFCEPCALRDTCQGGCKAAAQVCYGSLMAEEPFLHRNREHAQPL